MSYQLKGGYMETHRSKGQALIEVLISLTVLTSIWLVANRTISTFQSSQKKTGETIWK